MREDILKSIQSDIELIKKEQANIIERLNNINPEETLLPDLIINNNKINHELIIDKQITSNEKILYIYLLSVYNKHKKCSSVSLETIANNVNISLTTVKQSIKNLTRHGYMTVEKEMSNRGYINVYKNFKHLSIE